MLLFDSIKYIFLSTFIETKRFFRDDGVKNKGVLKIQMVR